MNKPLRLLLYLLFLVINATQTHAQAPVVHISPKPNWTSAYKHYDKKPAERDIENGAYDELVEEQINVEAEATYNHIITRVVSGSGVQNNSEISVSFDPSYQRLDFHDITVWRNNKPQPRLNTSDFKLLPQESELEKFIYDGTYSAKYILADIRKGDKIEYAYTITGRNPIFDHQFCRDIYLQGSGLIVHQYTTLLFPTSRKLNMKPFNLRSPPRISHTGGSTRYEWEDFQVPGVSSNKLQPKWINDYARVQVSEFNSWAEVIGWGMRVNPLQTTFTGELADSVASLKKHYGNNKEKYFRAAVTLVQDEVRYMGIETGQYSHKANLPDLVFSRRYGDCKDKSLLLASILNAGGIEAHLVLINTDLQDKIENLIPSATLFDHAVITATVNGKQIWVDATISYQGGRGVDLYFPPYGDGLVLKAGNNSLTKIPETKAGKIICEESFTIKNEYSPVTLKVITTYNANQADDERDHLAEAGRGQTEKEYLDYYFKTYNKIEPTDSLVVKDDRGKNELTTIENYTINNFFTRDTVNGKFTADFYADYISGQLPEIGGQINTPVAVNYPYAINYTVNVFLPYGWDITDEQYSLMRDAYKFTAKKTVKIDKLSLNYQFAYTKDIVSLNQLPQFKADIKDLKSDKLSFSFYYIPDINKIPFRVNGLIAAIAVVIIGIFVFTGLKIYKTETAAMGWHDRKFFPPPLSGWLVVLIVFIFIALLWNIKTLDDGGYFAMSKWNEVLTGVGSAMNRMLLVFEAAGYIIMACYSIFSAVLVLNKRDIATRYLKGYFLFSVVFLAMDYLFDGFVNGKYDDHYMEQAIRGIVIAVSWTYYLNTAEQVKRTFIVPYKRDR